MCLLFVIIIYFFPLLFIIILLYIVVIVVDDIFLVDVTNTNAFPEVGTTNRKTGRDNTASIILYIYQGSMPKKEEKSDSDDFVVKSYVKADTKKYAPKCDIALSKELQLQYRDEILMEYKESQIVVRKRFDCRGFIHRLIKIYARYP